MSTFQSRVEDYVGTIADTTALTDWLTAGAKRLIDFIPPDKLERFTTALTDAGSGIDVSTSRVIRAHKSNKRARRINPGLATQAGESGSIHEATTNSPAWYIDSTKGYVLPSGGSIIAVPYPTVLYSESSINNFPSEWEHGVVLYSAIQASLTLMNSAISSLGSLSLGTVTPPSAPVDASYSYSNASLGTYTATTIASGETAPTYTKPTTAASFTDLDSYISSEEDGAKADAEVNQQRAILEQYSLDLQNELNEFNKETEVYRQTLAKEIEQARLDQQRLIEEASKTTDLNLQNAARTLEAAISLYRDKLGKYQSQINSYQSEVNKEVSEYQADIQKATQKIAMYQNLTMKLQEEYKLFLETL